MSGLPEEEENLAAAADEELGSSAEEPMQHSQVAAADATGRRWRRGAGVAGVFAVFLFGVIVVVGEETVGLVAASQNVRSVEVIQLQEVTMISCSVAGDNCNRSKCCENPRMECYEKNEYWASCAPSCAVGVHADDPPEAKPEPWSCKVLSPGREEHRERAKSLPGASLFCYSVIQSGTYEESLVNEQRRRGVSIFDCEDHTVITNSFTSEQGGEGALATGSWTNVDVFVAAWRQIQSDGRFLNRDFTVKADPDTVFVPDKLRMRLTGKNFPANGIYLNNCDTYEYGFFGALEVVSRAAMNSLTLNLDRCLTELEFRGWGEDLFAQKCMDLVGVTPEADYLMVTDGNCGKAPAPCDTGSAAYHPYKVPEQYFACMAVAAGTQGLPTTPPPASPDQSPEPQPPPPAPALSAAAAPPPLAEVMK